MHFQVMYFSDGDRVNAFEHLKMVIDLDHVEAPYTLAFLKFISESEFVRDEGIDEIAKLKTGYRGIAYVSCCRF